MARDKGRALRAGVIGCGVGRSHIQGYRAAGVEIVALAGLDAGRCAAVAEEFSIPFIYGEYENLLARDDLDMVSVAVPNYLHADVVLAALERGLDVCVEKPLAHNLADAERIAAAAQNSRGQVMVMFNWRLRADAQALKRYLANGTLGRVYYAKAGWLRRSGIPGIGGWFTEKTKSGGGPLVDLGVHMLDLSMWLLDYPQAVAVSGATYAEFGPRGRGTWPGRPVWAGSGGGYDVEDLAAAFIRLADGVTLYLEASWAAYGQHKDDFYVHLFGSEGGGQINVRQYAEVDTLTVYTDMAGAGAEIHPTVMAGMSHVVGIEEFVAMVQGEKPNPAPPEQGVALMRIIDGIYRSAAEGREVSL